MRYLNKTSWLIFATVVSVAIFGVVSVVYVMLYSSIGKAAQDRTSFTEEAGLLETQNLRTNNIRSLIRNNTQVREELDTYFVKEDGVVTFLDTMENLGILAGTLVSVESVNLGRTIDNDKQVEELIVTFKSDGTISQLFHLLSLFEQFPKALFIESVKFTQHPTDLNWMGTFQMVLMRLKE